MRGGADPGDFDLLVGVVRVLADELHASGAFRFLNILLDGDVLFAVDVDRQRRYVPQKMSSMFLQLFVEDDVAAFEQGYIESPTI